MKNEKLKINSVPPVFSKRLGSLRPIIDAWIELQRDYIRKVEKDLPWWYKERPQVGFFAAAAVKKGAVALEEWATRKGQEKHKTKSGRNDLWIQYGGNEWFIEAKYVRCNLKDGEKSCIKTLKGYLSWAQKDAKKVAGVSAKSANADLLGILFATPVWESSNHKLTFGKAVARWKRVCRSVSADALVILTPDKKNELLKLYEKKWLIGMSLFMTHVPLKNHRK